MHVAADLNWFLQFVVLAFLAVFAVLYLVRDAASRYFVVDSNFDSSGADYSSLDRGKTENMAETGGGAAESADSCAVCGLATTKQCARCKMVKYCSEACQKSHWNSGHKTKCTELQSLYKANHTKSSSLRARKASLVPSRGRSKIVKQSNKILFPYEEFVNFFNWDKPGYPPCGLLNCGNSCFANVVLQCLTFTRPLIAYLLERGHRIECNKDDWCFLCEFQTHVERASRSLQPFSPMNILSRLPNIGGNLGYGKQEDAHEFMRFAIDTMQSVCLDEFGGEKTVHPIYQETTLIQHIFGGRLRSQVICTECNNVSNQFENMMDLTVEIHGDAGSLEECLNQFTAKEWLHGDNMYKCDGCNAYVMAWKRLTIERAPNILTIALKRFQSGRFGKLNKRVTFPETLDLNRYMSELEDSSNVYKLYAVIVHVDMLNASFFGHYICYVKDFSGNWYRIDDCKVARVDLDEVLSQGAYMLLYSRSCPRASCLLPSESLQKEQNENVKAIEVDPPSKQPAECLSDEVCSNGHADSGKCSSPNIPEFMINGEEKLILPIDIEDTRDNGSLPIVKDEFHKHNGLPISQKQVSSPVNHDDPSNSSLVDETPIQLDAQNSESTPSVSGVKNASHGSIENCTFEEGNITSNGSAMASTNSEIQGEAKPAYPTPMPKYVRSKNGIPSCNGIENGKKKSDGESSAKLKPIFAPGFLRTQTRKKDIDPATKVSSGLIESIPDLNNHTNGDGKSHLLYENGGSVKEHGSTLIRHENGMSSPKHDACKSLENGYSSDQSVVTGSG